MRRFLLCISDFIAAAVFTPSLRQPPMVFSFRRFIVGYLRLPHTLFSPVQYFATLITLASRFQPLSP